MPQYLVAGYLPDDFDPSQADEAMGREIHALPPSSGDAAGVGATVENVAPKA
jgi:hypothetical protein